MAGKNQVKTWLELDTSGIFHAGEYLRAVLHIVCSTSPSIELLIGTIQLRGELSITEQYVSPGSLTALVNAPGYGVVASDLHGGGSFFRHALETGISPLNRETFPIFATPPSVVVSGEELYELVQYSCITQPLKVDNRLPR